MDDTSGDEQPLSEFQIRAVLQALAADFEHTFPPDDWRLPPRPLSAEKALAGPEHQEHERRREALRSAEGQRAYFSCRRRPAAFGEGRPPGAVVAVRRRALL
jgi:hypothetical protein